MKPPTSTDSIPDIGPRDGAGDSGAYSFPYVIREDGDKISIDMSDEVNKMITRVQGALETALREEVIRVLKSEGYLIYTPEEVTARNLGDAGVRVTWS